MPGEGKRRSDDVRSLLRAIRASMEFEGANWAHGVLPRAADDTPVRRPVTAAMGPSPAAAPPKAKVPKRVGPAGGRTLSLFGEDVPAPSVAVDSEQKTAGEVLRWSGPKLSREDAAAALKELQDEIGPRCTRCPLGKLGRRQVVFGVGSADANLVFVGEGPGEDEDVQGEPFVGRAGQLLTKMIVAMGLERKDVYICNVVKCRPPGNRDPEREEERVCGEFLKRQLAIIRPAVVVALGKIAAMYLKGINDIPKEKFPISRYRGRFERYEGADMMLTFHPSYLLRAQAAKKDAWSDLQQVMKRLGLEPTKKKTGGQ